MDKDKALRLLENAAYGVLCMQALPGGGYGVPLHFVWDGAETVYLHCATEGYKLDCLTADPRACLVITGDHRVLPDAFSTAYESLLLHGEVTLVSDEEQKNAALRAFLTKYIQQSGPRGDRFLNHAATQTKVLQFRIITASGKSNRG